MVKMYTASDMSSKLLVVEKNTKSYIVTSYQDDTRMDLKFDYTADNEEET